MILKFYLIPERTNQIFKKSNFEDNSLFSALFALALAHHFDNYLNDSSRNKYDRPFSPGSMVTFTCIFVTITLVLTTLATSFLLLSLHSNEWEYMSYKVGRVEQIAQTQNVSLQWLNAEVARIEYTVGPEENSNIGNESQVSKAKSSVFYLVPAYGGVSKLCTDVSDSIRQKMKEDGQESETCISYLSNEKVVSRDSWLDRMRNLAMSCAIVCLILLVSSAPLGILGLIKKQISTIMVTGVMYSLAAVFGIFNLVFMRFKRVKSDGFYTSTSLDKGIPEDFLKTRVFTVGWPLSLECAGLCICILASLFWLLLAKIFRSSY
ncbi:hypothetical protein HNY73_001926 [Argiope bruennichi]|uniref:Uncharacterized protein n=1 Tax=Argiope bruennichi TaxID=94029 RepID=A0A8T0FRU6_ARGBR|nr:hypothetical protein HNY73_001926 [Argiope bruennichi]